ncbi:MAG: TonB-dependent receptor [Prevotellaceae bacterium]|jgi:TonB-linked SusC/RagA family outer membrane protein|nr:TonB-dependent receptor [Prevotellaceae bacterium]
MNKTPFTLPFTKMPCILLLLLCLTVLPAAAQPAKISLKIQEQPIRSILQHIENTSEYVFFYSDKVPAELLKTASVDVEAEPIAAVLDKVFAATNLTYEIRENQVSVLLKNIPAAPAQPKTTTITGKVTGNDDEPLIGATVSAVGHTQSTLTDVDGSYTITAPAGVTQLRFSYIGYTDAIETVNLRARINVTLQEAATQLDELVVIGYGTVRKRDMTGSVSSVKASDVNMTAAASIGHALKGKAAGLSIIQNSAQPGGGLNILVRGGGSVNASNKPLYVVDGFPVAQLEQPGSGNDLLDGGTQSVLNFLNPNDITSIEVLKDASATAIYGARAANGVVLITTKRGVEGKTTISYGISYGVQQHSNIFDLYNLKEWMTEKNNASWDFWMFENEVVPYGNRSLEEAMNFPRNGVKYKLPYTDTEIDNAGEGTDWVGLITRLGSVQQHNLNVQGGNARTKYLVSFNYFDHEGIIKNSAVTRYTGKANLDHAINKYVKLGVNLVATRLDNDNRALGDREFENSGLLRAAVQMGPHIQAIDSNGDYPVNPELPTQPNAYSLLNVQDHGRMDRLLANADLVIEPMKELLIKITAGTDVAYQSRKTYMPKSTLHGGLSNGIATINQNLNEQYLLEGTVNYSATFRSIHRLGVLAGASYERFVGNGHNLKNNDFIIDGFGWNSMGSGVGVKDVGSWGNENKMKSLFTRVNYTLLDRYLLTATFRADGASVFAKNHKWGYFPSIATAWNISEEPFMETVRPVLSMLKLRASFGQTGNSDIVENAFASYIAQPAWNTVDKDQIVGVFQSRLDNPNLKWETTTELNLGLDVALYDGRFSLTVELYRRVISDLLNYKLLNIYHDISRVIANIGKTQSHGLELTVNTKNFDGNDFSWATDFTFSTYDDRWLERTTDWKPSVYERVDDPIRARYSRIADHILQIGEAPPPSQPDLKPGQLVIRDINGYRRDEYGDPIVENGMFILTGGPDGIIDDADTRLMGSSDPSCIIGISNRFRWKNIDLSFDINGLFGRSMEDPTFIALGASADGIAQYGYNGLRTLKDRWTPDNPSTTQPSSFYRWSQYGAGDWFYQPAWFLRLQNVAIGYTLPKITALGNVAPVVRIYLDANNLFILTPYKGLDPETDVYTAAYPNARTFTIGLDVKF